MNNLAELLDNIKTVGIGGHVRPDGDCFGSCMAMYLYLKKWYPELETDLYLESRRDVFGYLAGFDAIRTEPREGVDYDLFITCDVSARDRLAVAGELFDSAAHTFCVDHHVSNDGFAEVNHIRGDVSSCCEVLYGLMDNDRIDRDIAEALYTGIVHDTGVFQYGNTSPETMQIAGELMKRGFDFRKIIEESFYQKTYEQNRMMGHVLDESYLILDGKCIVGCADLEEMKRYGVEPQDLDGIVAQLRLTTGMEAAVFLYEREPGIYKVSFRSNGPLDVSRIAVHFGGGGHLRASGCDLSGTPDEIVALVAEQIALQLEELQICGK